MRNKKYSDEYSVHGSRIRELVTGFLFWLIDFSFFGLEFYSIAINLRTRVSSSVLFRHHLIASILFMGIFFVCVLLLLFQSIVIQFVEKTHSKSGNFMMVFLSLARKQIQKQS